MEESILALPPKLQARFLRMLELIARHGVHLGYPHTRAMGNGLFEIRAKSMEGIARGLYCYQSGQRIIVLHVFVKKTQKTPPKELDKALKRLREVKKHDT
ncbi:phage-related protein [Tamilnaduibacter salinus]|uniref:Phage-related protein n=1 Tax=Tamilnaduibacter salinus TaxID=1484056 RepID=A0A2U1CU70_9GAMM|nr:type II toxin-antitoxin system RelE/ParE family toxin [Tamilnaduibacter salinus]PVY70389.1 phage-related protein [Tamilnaduibacter salinus]